MKTEILEAVLAEVCRARGLDFSQYRRSTLSRRLADRMARLGCDHSEEYLRRLRSDPHETDQLVNTFAINVSAFFRDPLVYHVLAETVLPRLQKDARGDLDLQVEEPPVRAGMRAVHGEDRKASLRIWSAGCATGEEPYSVAILLREFSARHGPSPDPLIFATDIDRAALATAEKASYARAQLLDVRLGILDKYFEAHDDRYRLKADVRKMVRFSIHDLVSETTRHPPESVFGGFHLILCRNLLIYFSDELQRRVLAKFCEALIPGGFLVLGQAEELTENVRSALVVEDRACRVFRKR